MLQLSSWLCSASWEAITNRPSKPSHLGTKTGALGFQLCTACAVWCLQVNSRCWPSYSSMACRTGSSAYMCWQQQVRDTAA